jgi:hypothetical protein
MFNNGFGVFQAESGALTEPLWDAATNPYPYPSNGAFVREYTIKLLSTSFPNMTAAEVIFDKHLIFTPLLCLNDD